eukprot:7271832-Ditylum_brightwellii.AAC.1
MGQDTSAQVTVPVSLEALPSRLRHLEDLDYENDGPFHDIGSTLRFSILLLFLLLLGVVGRRRRMRTRFAILRARAQEDHLYFTSHPEAPPGLVKMESASVLSPVSSYADDKKREDKYDGACSHTLCGCYPVDPVQYVDEDGEEYT